jgi:AcrR family transcriptional regulator
MERSALGAAATPEPVAETKGTRTRQRLLDLAIERFGSQGHRATSVSEIARAAGLTQAAVYAYFDNKDSLFVSAVDADATSLVIDAHDALTGTPVREIPQTFLVNLYLRLDDHPLARRVLAGQEPEVLPRLIDLPAIRMATRLIVQDMQAGQEAGEVRRDIDPAVLGDGVEAMILSLLLATVQSDGLYTPRYQDGVYAAFDAMLKPAP